MADAYRSKASTLHSAKAIYGPKGKSARLVASRNQQQPPGATSVLPRIDRREASQSPQASELSASSTSAQTGTLSVFPTSQRTFNKDAFPREEDTSPTFHGDEVEGPSAKAAWCTPRGVGANTDSLVASFFAEPERNGGHDGCTTPTPLRLQTVESDIYANEERYRVDMEQLSSNNDKFLEISMSANQHLEHVHDQLPSIGETFDQTSCALQSLSDSIATLHQQHENAEQNMSSQFDAAMNDNAEEMAALSESHTNELAGLCQAHTRQLHHAENIFNDKITELEAKYQKMEKMYLRDLEELRQTSSLQIQGLQEAKRTDKEEQEEMMKRTIEKLQNKANEELEDLRSHTEAAYKELQKRSQAEYAELQRLSTKKLSEVRATLSTEITILKRNSVAELAACTGKAEQDLEELRAQHHEMLQKLQAEYSIERAQLLEKASEEVARLHMLSIDESTQMEIRQYREAMALRKALQTTQVEYSNQVQGLHRRYTSQIEALKATSEGEKAIIRKAHAAETQNMRAAAAHELSDKILFYEDRLCAVREAHEAEARRDVEEATQAKDLLVAKYESDLVSLQHERMREKDELILRYETKLDAAKRASTEEYENVVKLHDTQMAQLREANLSKVLSLEMAMRDLNKQMEETTRDKDAELMSRQKRIEILEASELVLRDYQHQFAEQCRELTEQKSMALCELDHEIWRLDRLTVEKDLMLSDTYRDLKAIKDDHDIKANTILELTFVIKSRDDEIEKLRKALLDNVRTMNTKTEILELTTETLSSKAKELEATKNALRLESGRLSKVEESMHQKDGLLENTELKMESMRLSMENMRLEMKRMQMDMKLQMEHAEGEIELKNGEIRRLHGNQSELKQKNDFCQQTIERLEESLTLTQRQGEESQRRIDLLRLEVTQAAEALSHVSDQLAAKERKLVIITREKQAASSEKQRLQIAYNNLALRMQTLREKIELRTMQLEEVRLQYQEILKKALEEKDERLRSEKRLLILELSSSKDTIRHLEGVKVQLDGTTQRLAVMASEKKNLEAEIQVISQTLEKLEKSDRVLHTAKKDIELKNKFIAEKVQEIEDLNELLRRTQQEAHHCLNACRMEIEDSMSKVFSLICSNVDNIRLTDHLKLSLSNLRAEKEQLMLALGQEKREIMVRAENLQEKLAGMRAGGARAANEINDLQHALCEKKKELAYLQENLAEQTAETRRVQSVCDALSSSRVKLLADVGSEHEKENQKHLGTIRLMEQNLESKVEACQKLEKCTEDQRQERCYLLDNLTTKHGNHENQLIAGYQNKIARIEENHHNERSQLRDSHSREISKLREDYECDVTRIEENYRNEILQVEENRRCEVDQLIEAHLKFVVQLSAKHCGEFGLFHGGREWKLKQINATFTAENATNRSVKFENQQLRTHHDLPQSRVFGWHQALLTQAENELVHIVCAHLLEMMTTQVEHNHDITSMKEYATGIEEFYNVPPAAEYAQVLKNLRQEHVSDKAAADQLVHAQSPSGENVKDELAATSVQTMELTEFRLREGHQTKISRLLETACADEEHHVATLAAIHDESESTTNALKCSEEMVTLLKTKIIHLQEQLQNAQQEATDRKADIAVKNATIESIRKELNLKIETSESTGSVDQFIVLLRQQLETYVMEVYHIELNELEGFSLKREIDVLECVKGFTAMRYYRHMPLTMSENTLDLVTCVDDICVRLQEYDRVVSMLEKAPVSSGNDDQKLPPSRHISAIVGDLDRLKLSVHHLFVGPTDDSGGAKDYDASTWEQILGNLTDLFEILAIPADANNSLIRSQQVVHMLKENQNLMLDARLSSLKDEEHRFPSIGDVLVRARDVTKSDNLVSLEDLMVLFDELEGFYKELNTLRSLNNGKNGSDSPLSDITVAHESSLGMTTRDEAMAFIQRCKTALQLSTDKTSLDDIVKAIEQLMKILQHFEVLEPKMDSPRRNVTSDSIGENSKSSTLTVWMPTIENKVTAILAFVEELKLMADFAQSILNDENKSLRDPASNESSRSSLAELQVLTRTSSPESLGELQDDIDFVIDGVVHGYDRSCHNEVPSTNREDLSSQPFLVDSLVDISLVMSDHQRLLSQTAQWVLKSRQGKTDGQNFSRGMEISRLVREHCALLSLSRRLFKMKDPRRDLASLLEGIAFLWRTTGQLTLFQSSAIRETNEINRQETDLDESASTRRNTSESFQSLRESDTDPTNASVRPVVTSIGDMVRHLQDYDYLLQQIKSAVVQRCREKNSSVNIEELVQELNDLVALMEHSKALLGLQELTDELPQFIVGALEVLRQAKQLRETSLCFANPSTKCDEDQHDVTEERRCSMSETGIEAILREMDAAVEDLQGYNCLLVWLKQILPAPESVNSVADLKECLQAELMKVEHLTRENATVLQDKAQLVKDTERIKRNQGVQEEDEFVPRAKLTEMDKAYAEERVFLSSKEALSEILDVGGSEIGAFSRIAVYQQLFDEIMRLRDEKHAAESYAIQEYELLRAHDLLPTSTSACNTTLPSLSTLSSIRLQLFQQLADSLVHQRQQDSKLSQELVRESRYLQENNVVFDANDPHTSRLAVYKTLLAGQNTLIEEKMEREVALESEKAFLVSYGVPRCESNMEIFKHYVLLRQQLVALTTELQEELRFLAENQLCTSEDLSSDVASLMTPFSSSLRFQVYQKLLQAEIRGSETNRFLQESMELQLSKQTEAADSDVASLTRRIERLETELMGSNEFIYVSQREYEHMLLKEEENRQELARAFEVTQEQAEKDHTRELEKTIEVRDNAAMLAAATYAEALERAAKEHEEKLASQLQKQAGQLEFAAFVHDDYESHKRVNDTPNTSTHLSAAQVRAQLLERFAKRDTAAISMIYKAIRLTTDILSTAPTASVGSTGGQFVTADITQAVLSCVKELKALKEYLVQSLEYATQGGDQEASLTFAQAPFAKWTADAVARATADKESAIDLALCSHREFMTFAQTQLQTRQDEVEIALIRLYGKLKAAATHGAFTADQEKLLALELEAMREKEAKENVVCKFRLNEEYYRRLLDDRKEMEIAQAAVVVELRQENKTLRRNLKNLEQQLQQVTVVPSFRPSSCAVLASTPRVSVISPRILKCAAVSTAQIPMRPERPRGGGSVHKDRFVSDLERDTGQRRTDTTTRRLNDWKSREDVFAETPGTQLEQDFRALQAIKSGNHGMQIEPAAPPMMAAPATAPGSSLQNQELWYRGVRSVHFVSFFISVFHVPRQQLFRVEVFNSDTEQQQQTVYVTWAEMLAFLHESSKAARRGIALPVDPDVAANVPQHVRVETMDILFERARVYGEGTGNVLLGFE